MAESVISIVIPAYYGDRTIADCLRAVEEATRGRNKEVIVVNSSPDATPDIVRSQFPDVVLIDLPERRSAGAARNLGAGRARGKLIFFLDQDCIVPRTWVDRLEEHLMDPSISGAGGSVGIRDWSNISGSALYFLEFLNHFPTRNRAQRNSNFLVACNCVYRAEVVREIPFPEQTLGEDILFSKTLETKGLEIIYDPGIEVLHSNRQGWRAFFDYNSRMGQASAKYHEIIRLWWAVPVLRFPGLAFLAPLAVLPSIAFDLLRAPPSYLLRFLLLSPMCFMGNLVWAAAFRREVRSTRAIKS